MAIVRQDVIDGPNVQASGEHRGIVEFEFGSVGPVGTAGNLIVTKPLRAPNLAAWSELLVDIGDVVQTSQEESDASEGVSPDEEVVANGQASIEQRAVAYLRAAWETELAYDAFLLFDKFNDFRLAKGWNLNQVAAELASAGLESDEWDAMKTSYQYLSGGQRPATMSDAKTIQANWEAR